MDKKIETFPKKLQQQEELIIKLRKEEQKLNTSILEYKSALAEKEVGDDNKNIGNERIVQQLEKQIQNSKNMLKNYQIQLANLKKRSNSLKTDSLQQLDETLQIKQIKLKKLKDEIKDLHFVKRKQQKFIEKKQKCEDGTKLTRLVEQMRKNKEKLEQTREKHSMKKQALEKKREKTHQLQQKYRQRCIKIGEQPTTYQEYKLKKTEKKRTFNQNSSKRKLSQKKYKSVREIINTQISLNNIEYNQKTLLELRYKKEIAQNSLKNTERKYDKQMEDLNKKLNTLKLEKENLMERLLQKRKQKEITEKFLEGELNSKNSTSKANIKLNPI